MFNATEGGHLDVIEYILELCGRSCKESGNIREVLRSGFAAACVVGNLDLAKYFIRKNSNVIDHEIIFGRWQTIWTSQYHSVCCGRAPVDSNGLDILDRIS